MAANALKKITTRAKELYRKGGTWKGAIKKAGSEYRSGSLGKVVRMKTKKREKVSGTLSGQGSSAISGVRRKAARSHKKRTVGSVATHVSKAKELIGKKIAAAELSKFKAKKKMQKRKITKRITALKSQYRKLC